MDIALRLCHTQTGRDRYIKANLKPFGLVPMSLLNEKGITLTAIRLYAALASFQGQDDRCWPSRDKIWERAGINSKRGYYDALSLLERLGWVTIQQRGLGKTNIYYVKVDVDTTPEVGTTEVPDGETHEVPEPGTSLYITKTTMKTGAPNGADDKSICGRIEKRFKEYGEFSNYGKERANIKRLLRACKNHNPDNPEGEFGRVFDTFIQLRGGKDKFWRAQPPTPSALLGLFDRVRAMELDNKATTLDDVGVW